jgi:hypothetical protein
MGVVKEKRKWVSYLLSGLWALFTHPSVVKICSEEALSIAATGLPVNAMQSANKTFFLKKKKKNVFFPSKFLCKGFPKFSFPKKSYQPSLESLLNVAKSDEKKH